MPNEKQLAAEAAGIGASLRSGGLAILVWLVAGMCWIASLVSFVGRVQRRRLLDAQSGLESRRAMSWRKFELLVAEAYRRLGYRVKESGLGGADGGVDLILRRDGQTVLVQCKQWRSQKVSAPVVREQFGLLIHHAAAKVAIATVGHFTDEARAFALGKPIELLNGAALVELVRSVQSPAVRCGAGRWLGYGAADFDGRWDCGAIGYAASLSALRRFDGGAHRACDGREVSGLLEVSDVSWDAGFGEVGWLPLRALLQSVDCALWQRAATSRARISVGQACRLPVTARRPETRAMTKGSPPCETALMAGSRGATRLLRGTAALCLQPQGIGEETAAKARLRGDGSVFEG